MKINDVCLIHERHVLGNGNNKKVLSDKNLHKVYGDKIALNKATDNVIFKV